MATKLRQYLIYIYTKKSRGLAQKKGQLTIECDEMWSFVGTKKNKQWIWLALDIQQFSIE
jgi:hypothetical protein